MPHTNRARRAQHFRSIDNSVGQSDGNIVNAPTKRTAKPLARGGDLSNDAPEAGLVGEGGPGSGGVGHQRKAANVKGGKKAPSAKNRIRSLTRLLNKPGVDESKRQHLKAQVEALEAQVSEREKKERERTIAVKYHKAKFFDRRKALRRLAQVHKKLKEDVEEDARLELEERRRSEEADLKYVLYFPRDKRYLPLGKGKEGPPRARRSHERFLQEALVRGEAAGWEEFRKDLDKFVTGAGGGGSGPLMAADAAAEAIGDRGSSGGIKRKRGVRELPVVAQEDIWGEEGEGQGGQVSTAGLGAGAGEDDAGGEREGGAPATLEGSTTKPPARKDGGGGDNSIREKKRRTESGLSGSKESDGSMEEEEEEVEEESVENEKLSNEERFGLATGDEESANSTSEAKMGWVGGGEKARAAAVEGDAVSTEKSSRKGRCSGEGVNGALGNDREVLRGGDGDERNDGSDDSDDNDGSARESCVSSRSSLSNSALFDVREDRFRDRSEDGREAGEGWEDAVNDGNGSDSLESEDNFDGRKGQSIKQPPQQPRTAPAGSDSSSSSGDDIALDDDFFLEEAGPSVTEKGEGGEGERGRGPRGDRSNSSNRIARGRGNHRFGTTSGRGWTPRGHGAGRKGGDRGRLGFGAGGRGGRWRGGRGGGDGRGKRQNRNWNGVSR